MSVPLWRLKFHCLTAKNTRSIHYFRKSPLCYLEDCRDLQSFRQGKYRKRSIKGAIRRSNVRFVEKLNSNEAPKEKRRCTQPETSHRRTVNKTALIEHNTIPANDNMTKSCLDRNLAAGSSASLVKLNWLGLESIRAELYTSLHKERRQATLSQAWDLILLSHG